MTIELHCNVGVYVRRFINQISKCKMQSEKVKFKKELIHLAF